MKLLSMCFIIIIIVCGNPLCEMQQKKAVKKRRKNRNKRTHTSNESLTVNFKSTIVNKFCFHWHFIRTYQTVNEHEDNERQNKKKIQLKSSHPM